TNKNLLSHLIFGHSSVNSVVIHLTTNEKKNNAKMYYHYTNTCGAEAIRSSLYILPSDRSGAFGPGVYLTDLDPQSFFREEILANNYGIIRTGIHNRADWVVQVNESDINIKLLRQIHVPGEGGRRIFVYPHRIYIKISQIFHKPQCLRSYCDDNSEEEEDEETGSSERELELDDGSDVSEYDGDGGGDVSEYDGDAGGDLSEYDGDDGGDVSEYDGDDGGGEIEYYGEDRGDECEYVDSDGSEYYGSYDEGEEIHNAYDGYDGGENEVFGCYDWDMDGYSILCNDGY
ncbi:hypothetical protein Bhyg_04729, partial [Pseudolycoriella hygida]